MIVLFLSLALSYPNHCPYGPEVSSELRDLLEPISHIEGLNFRQSFEDPEVQEPYLKSFGPRCVQAIRTELAKGPLYLATLYYQSKPLRSFWRRLWDDEPVRFYHWTSSKGFVKKFLPDERDRDQAHQTLLDSKVYRDIFHRTRTTRASMVPGLILERQAFYVASSPLSSSRFGNHQITLGLDPKARTIKLHDLPWGQLKEEIIETYPGLEEACGVRENLYDFLGLFLEGSGIAIAKYYRVKDWYYLIGTGAVVWSDAQLETKPQ